VEGDDRRVTLHRHGPPAGRVRAAAEQPAHRRERVTLDPVRFRAGRVRDGHVVAGQERQSVEVHLDVLGARVGERAAGALAEVAEHGGDALQRADGLPAERGGGGGGRRFGTGRLSAWRFGRRRRCRRDLAGGRAGFGRRRRAVRGRRGHRDGRGRRPRVGTGVRGRPGQRYGQARSDHHRQRSPHASLLPTSVTRHLNGEIRQMPQSGHLGTV
jgi:hypothetical protein